MRPAPPAGSPVAPPEADRQRLPQLAGEEYRELSRYLEGRCGLALGDGKEYLVQSRLAKLLAELRLAGYAALLERLRDDREAGLREAVIDAMTTHETYWFRDRAAFDVLEHSLLPQFDRAGHGQLRLWCAGCSSGQEPYSVAMSFAEYRRRNPGTRLSLSVLASDISRRLLALARDATYPDKDLARGLDEERRRRYFQPCGSGYRLDPELAGWVRFRDINLLDPLAAVGAFDVIFCRNVLIYFSPSTKADMAERISAQLAPGGHLFLGGSESLLARPPGLALHRQRGCVYYRRATSQ